MEDLKDWLPWYDKIVDRLKEFENKEEYLILKDFIQPILLYGESEVKRIRDIFKDGTTKRV